MIVTMIWGGNMTWGHEEPWQCWDLSSFLIHNTALWSSFCHIKPHFWTLTLSAVFHISPSLPWSVSSLVFKLVTLAKNAILNFIRQHQHQRSTSPMSSILSLTSVQDYAKSAPIAPVRFYSDPASLIIVVIKQHSTYFDAELTLITWKNETMKTW